MMNKLEYWEKSFQAIAKRAFFVVGLCAVILAGCSGSDRALTLRLQEETGEFEISEDGAVERRIEESETAGSETAESEPAESENAMSKTAESGVTEDKAEVSREWLYVHVCGAVVSPGVVELPAGSRAADALAVAGGFREDAATDYVNLASRVEDGQQLYFPTLEEAQVLKEEGQTLPEGAQSATSKQQTQLNGKVNINTADEELLCTLPGIGEARAQDIIAYRQEHGGFGGIEDIMKVPGIKQSAYEKLYDKITVN